MPTTTILLSLDTYQPVPVGHRVQAVKVGIIGPAAAEDPQGVFLVAFRQAAQHNDLVVPADAQVAGIHRPVAVLVEVGKRRRGGDIQIRSHKWAGLRRDLLGSNDLKQASKQGVSWWPKNNPRERKIAGLGARTEFIMQWDPPGSTAGSSKLSRKLSLSSGTRRLMSTSIMYSAEVLTPMVWVLPW